MFKNKLYIILVLLVSCSNEIQNLELQKHEVIDQKIEALADENFYNISLKKGEKYLKKLQKEYLESDDVEQLLLDEKKRDSSAILYFDFDTKIIEEDQEIKTQSVNKYFFEEYNGDEMSSNKYFCSYQGLTKTFTCEHVSHGIKNKFPPSVASVIWNHFSFLKIKNIISESNEIETIKNFDIVNAITLNVIFYIIKKLEIHKKERIEALTLDFPVDSEEGKALLGTPNGISSIWLCCDYSIEMNKKKPHRVIVNNFNKYLDGYTADMYVHLK